MHYFGLQNNHKGRLVLFFLIGTLTLVGTALSIYFVTKSNGASTSNNNNNDGGGNDGDRNGGGGSVGIGDGNGGVISSDDNGNGPGDSSTGPDTAPSLGNPETKVFSLNALAIGDWGSTTYKRGGSCCNRYRQTGTDTVEYFKDYHSQYNIADMLADSAGKMSPKAQVIISHGDNFYWNGIGPKDVENRFATTFESKYDQPELSGIPWVSVAGNHDMAGSGYICGEEDNRYRKCTSIAEMLQYLNGKFDLQSNYVSPNQNRWFMPAHYFKYTIEDVPNNVTMDIFNVDTNFADSHGARQVCCQCYGYSQGDDSKCNNVDRGDTYCAGGDTDMFDACFALFKTWFDDSLTQVQIDAKASTADWKIVNSHYSPHFHMSPAKMTQWHDALRGSGIQVFMNGHTHGENHDYSKSLGTHFFENGAGGGIQSEVSGFPPPAASGIVQNVWIGNNAPYGFFELSASKDWLKMSFITFGDGWSFSTDLSKIKKGKTQVGHCWYIPRDGTYGKECLIG